MSLAASGVRSDRRAAVGLCVENVGLEREWVDKLVVVRAAGVCSRRAYDTRRNWSDKFRGLCDEGAAVCGKRFLLGG